MKSEVWRVFCAIELTPEVRAHVIEHISRLRAAAPNSGVSWGRDEALHITLKFLGEVESTRVAALSRAAERAAHQVDPFSLVLENTGAFPTHGAARVLWIGVGDYLEKLAKLQQSLEDECASEGFTREARSFHPHLTIARQRSPKGARTPTVLDRETPFQPIEFAVTELVVMRSELGAGGSRYTKLSRHAL